MYMSTIWVEPGLTEWCLPPCWQLTLQLTAAACQQHLGHVTHYCCHRLAIAGNSAALSFAHGDRMTLWQAPPQCPFPLHHLPCLCHVPAKMTALPSTSACYTSAVD